MNKKDLQKLGFTDEALEKAGLKPEILDEIIVLHGKDIEAKKTELQTTKDELTAVQGQLTEANKTIEGFKKLDPEGIKQASKDWETKAKDWEKKAGEAKTEADKRIADMKFDQALSDSLKEAKVKDPTDVIPHLKKDMLKLGDDGKFVGLTEQLDALKKSKDYLFETDGKTPKIVAGGNNKTVIGDPVIDAARKAAGLPVEGENKK
jgi:chromosome segregation ATPase